MDAWARRGVLAVERQAASRFAFGRARKVAAGLVARVIHAIDHDGEAFHEAFHKGPEDAEQQILTAICRAAASTVAAERKPRTRRPHASPQQSTIQHRCS